MRGALTNLDGATVQPDGAVIDQGGRPTGVRVNPGGFLVLSAAGQRLGTISLAGRIYDQLGNLVARVSRQDRAR